MAVASLQAGVPGCAGVVTFWGNTGAAGARLAFSVVFLVSRAVGQDGLRLTCVAEVGLASSSNPPPALVFLVLHLVPDGSPHHAWFLSLSFLSLGCVSVLFTGTCSGMNRAERLQESAPETIPFTIYTQSCKHLGLDEY